MDVRWSGAERPVPGAGSRRARRPPAAPRERVTAAPARRCAEGAARDAGGRQEAQVTGPDMSRGARLAAHGGVSTALALCSDRRLRELVDAAPPAGSGIGGRTARALLPLRTRAGRGRLRRPAPRLRPVVHTDPPGELAGRRAARVRPRGAPGVRGRLRPGSAPGDMPPAIAALLVRHASVAAVMGDFTHRFRRESRTTAFPLEAIRRIERRDDPPGAPAGGTPRGDGPRPAAPRT